MITLITFFVLFTVLLNLWSYKYMKKIGKDNKFELFSGYDTVYDPYASTRAVFNFILLLLLAFIVAFLSVTYLP